MTGFLDLDPAAEAHLLRALEVHRMTFCRDSRIPLPASLDALARSLAARSGQARPGSAPPVTLPDPDPVALLPLPAASRMLAVSERTLRRLVADGHIPVVRIAGSTRIDADDLAAYIDQQKETR